MEQNNLKGETEILNLLSRLSVVTFSFDPSKAKNDLKLVCYYGSWAIYRKEPTSFTPSMLDKTGCTHMIYSFAGLDEKTGKITSLDVKMDLEQGWVPFLDLFYYLIFTHFCLINF